MKQLFPRGKRIRPTDKDLVFYTALASLLPVFLLVVLLFHIGQIAGTNWQEVSLSQIVQDVNIPYLLFSMGVASTAKSWQEWCWKTSGMNRSRERRTLFSRTCLPAVPKKPSLTFPKSTTG